MTKWIIIAVLIDSCQQMTKPSSPPAKRTPASTLAESQPDAPSEKTTTAKDPALLAFEENVHPLLAEHCATCHDADQTPLIAAENSKVAFKEIKKAGAVDFEAPENSRIVARLEFENHNCWSSCKKNAKELVTAIKAWVSEEDSATTSSSKLTTPARTINDGNTLSPDPAVKLPVNAVPTAVVRLKFPLTELVNLPDVYLTLDVYQLDKKNLLIVAPTLITPKKKIRVSGLKILIDGKSDPRNNTFDTIDLDAPPPSKVLSPSQMSISTSELREDTAFKVQFDKLEAP